MRTEPKKMYVIIPRWRLTDEMLENCTSAEQSAIKLSKNKKNVILKFICPPPACFANLKLYDQQEILQVLRQEEREKPKKRPFSWFLSLFL